MHALGTKHHQQHPHFQRQHQQWSTWPVKTFQKKVSFEGYYNKLHALTFRLELKENIF
jgi:hypothetical protein